MPDPAPSPRALAAVTARREHRRVEVTADRTAFSQTFANPDGTMTSVVWAQRAGELQSARPTASESGQTPGGRVLVGNDRGSTDRGEFVFNLPPAATGPTVNVVSATLTAQAMAAGASGHAAHTITVRRTSPYTAASTWDSPPAAQSDPVAAQFTTASTAPGQNVTWNVVGLLQPDLQHNGTTFSAELASSGETSNSTGLVAFSSSPQLSVTYSQAPGVTQGIGPIGNATFLTFPISDKATLKVNVGSGNALFTTDDITLPEQGSSLTLGMAYNSLLAGAGFSASSGATGWTQRQGVDVGLSTGQNGSVTLLGPDGEVGTFTASGNIYTSPAVFHATLANSSGSTCGGTGWTLTWHDTGQQMCFNTSGQLTSQADRNGNTTAFTYNSSAKKTGITYTPKGASSPTQTVNTTLSSCGCYLTGLTENGGSAGTKTVTYSLNSGTGNLSSITQADNTTLTLGYDGANNLTSIKNGAGVTTQLNYDSSHRVTSVSQIYGSTNATATTRLSYVSSTETQVADPNTNQSQAVSAVPNTTYTINGQGLVTTTVDQQNHPRSTAYDSFNNVKTSTNAQNATTTNTWSAAADGIDENLTASQSGTGATAKAAYGNANTTANPTAEYQPSSSTDAQNNKTAYTYDGAGNLQQSADALPATAKVTYNSDGTPATSTDPKNGTNSTSYSYNSLHQLTKVTPPTGNSLAAETLTYDGFGRTATITDGDGNTVTYTYDNADRITKEAFTGGSKTVTVTYAYDGAGNLKTQTDPSGTTSFTYDGRNKVLTKTVTSGGGTLTYGYDADGNLTLVKDAGGSTTYTYDTRNLLSSLKDPAGNLWQFAYNADGLRTTTWFATNTGNTSWGMEQVTSYDKADRISRIQTYRASSTSNVVSDVSYCYSPYVSGQACPTASASTDKALLQWSENNQTSTVSQYTYDAGDRLKTATNYGGTSYSYGYDTDGNLTSGGTAGTQTFNSANQSTVSGYTYDGAGNTATTPGNGTFTYNDAEQWTGASATGETFTYAGAGMNQLLSDGSATGITYGLAGQDGQAWVQSYTPTGSATDYVIHDQQGTPLGYVQSGTAYAFGTDNLGSVTNVIASCGCLDATYAYTPYGHINSVTGTDGNQNLIRYTGALYDITSNYWHFGNRWNNAYTSNFTTQDTSNYLADPENGNRYAYASDNPVNYTDPTGTCSGILGVISCAVTVLKTGAAAAGVVGAGGCAIGFIVALAPGCGVGGAIGGFVGFWGGVGWESAAEIEG
jgi:RHS repeat-associated protein